MMWRSVAKLALALAIICCPSTELIAQATDAKLVATITDAAAGLPISNALVSISRTGRVARTDSLGSARIEGIPAGAFTVRVQALGHAPVQTQLTFALGDTVQLMLQLRPIPVVLRGLDVTESYSSPWLRDFEQRRSRGSGRYITATEIQRSHGSDLATLLESRIPGIRGGGRVYSTRGPNSFSGSCQVAVYLDGMRIFGGNAGLVPMSLLGGIEYYTPVFVPVQFKESASSRGGGSAACGVLLLWTQP